MNDEVLQRVIVRIFQTNHTETPAIHFDRDASICFPAVFSSRAHPWRRWHPEPEELSEGCNVYVRRRELLLDHGSLVDQVGGSTVTSTNFVLLNNFKSLCRDPFLGTKELEDFTSSSFERGPTV